MDEKVNRTFAGIDPGITGAIAILDAETGDLLSVIDMPVCLKNYGAGKGQKVNCESLAEILGMNGVERCTVETVTARPGQGVTSMFSFGHSAGTIEGVLAALNINAQFVLPKRWQSIYAHKATWDKSESTRLAAMIYPEINLVGSRDGVKHGRADAALIARWGWESLQKQLGTDKGMVK